MKNRRKCYLIISIISVGIFIVWLMVHTINSRIEHDISSRTIYKSDIIRYNSNKVTNVRIPRVIHQTYRTHDVPPRWNSSVQSVMEKNIGEFKYRRWSDDQMNAFVKEREPEFYSKTYITYPHNIQRIDSFRYVLMFHLGGIYIDMDNTCNHPFHNLIITLESLEPNATYLAAFPRQDSFGIEIDFMMSSPGHPFYRQLISRLHLFNHNYFLHFWTIVISTGPMYASIQERFFSSSQESVVRLLDYFVVRPMYIGKDHGLTWLHQEDETFFRLGKKITTVLWYCKLFVIIIIIIILIKWLLKHKN